MTLLASFAVSVAGRGAARRFAAATRDPADAQLQKLRAILAQNRDTEYGREHGFASLESLADYARAVPIVTYPDLEQRMERVARGAKNVFTAEDPVMFARTSGTTGKPKLIPVTPTCRGRDHKDQMRTWLWHAQRDHRALLRGKVLSLVSPAIEGRTEAGIPYGSTSGHIYAHINRVIKTSYAVPYEVFEVEDYDAKYYALMRIGLVSDITFLCTANPTSIVRLCEVADERADALLRDIADGTLSREIEMPAATRQLVEAALRPDPALARRLEAARKRRDGHLLPADYWPHLALIGCWKGGTVASYVDRFPEWFAPDDRPPVPVRDWGYLSSEARGSIPISDEGCGGVLAVGTNVYEFVPAEQVDAEPERRERWQVLGAHELEVGKDYYVLLTTTGGLYRYHIDDVVGVEGRHQETPVVVFRRKGGEVTSITGEKVSATQVQHAVAAAAREAGVRVDHFKAVADVERAVYLLQVESGRGMPEGARSRFAEAFDRVLAEANLEYAAKRKSQRLNVPELEVMESGWYERAKREQVKGGKRQFQWKPSLLELKAPKQEAPKQGEQRGQHEPEAEREPESKTKPKPKAAETPRGEARR